MIMGEAKRRRTIKTETHLLPDGMTLTVTDGRDKTPFKIKAQARRETIEWLESVRTPKAVADIAVVTSILNAYADDPESTIEALRDTAAEMLAHKTVYLDCNPEPAPDRSAFVWADSFAAATSAELLAAPTSR